MTKTTLLYLIFTFCFFWIEFYLSCRKTSIKDRLHYLVKDIPFALMNILVPPVLIKFCVGLFAKLIYYVDPIFTPLFKLEQVNVFFILIGGLLFSDLVGYVYHRYLYHQKWGWILHRAHHSAEVVRWHTSFRFNPIELVITTSTIYCVFYIVGVPFNVFYKLTLFNYFINYLNHSEINFRNRWIEYIFITPGMHRIHHHANGAHQRSNYGGVFSFWDRILGSMDQSQYDSNSEILGQEN